MQTQPQDKHYFLFQKDCHFQAPSRKNPELPLVLIFTEHGVYVCMLNTHITSQTIKIVIIVMKKINQSYQKIQNEGLGKAFSQELV